MAGLGNALRTVAALLLMCDPRDLGVALTEEIAGGLEKFEPNLYLYDNYPGGVGQSAPLYRMTRLCSSRPPVCWRRAAARRAAPRAWGRWARSASGGRRWPTRILTRLTTS